MVQKRARGEARVIVMALKRTNTVLRVIRSMLNFGDVKLVRDEIRTIIETEIEHSNEILRDYPQIKEE